MRNIENILISGAGIAGPSLAHLLNRRGFATTVVERAPALRAGGYAVDFRGDAHLTVLERMGLLDQVRNARTNMGAAWYVDEKNTELARLPAEILSGDIEILRGDLVRILYEATRNESEYIFGDSVTALSQHDDGVDVTFEHAQPRTFDLVVGADGLHSNVRRLGFGEESRFLRHLGYHVAIFTTANRFGLDHSGRFYTVPGKVSGIYSARENTEAKALFYFASEPLDYDQGNVEQQHELVADAFAGEGWEIPLLLDEMREAPDFYFDSVSQVHMDTWSNGRVALLGDAGYCASPLSGMGTGLAVVGAYVLAEQLTTAPADHRAALAGYEGRMRNYVKACQKSARGAGSWFVPESRARIWMRNVNFRLLPHMPWRHLVADMARRTANGITIG